MAVTKQDITKAAKELGVKEGDIVLVHSSYKSLGEIDDGAETVIQGYLDAVGEEGTLVFPCFTQKDFEKAYETWHIDKPSDTGYLTNYFRTREGSVRSDQATHSVAACGKLATELTKTHGHTHKRWGNMGDTPFSADSPWEKMYNMNARVILQGVDASRVTFRHYAEYVYINEVLDSIKDHPRFEEMKSKLWSFCNPGLWPHVYNVGMQERLEKLGKWKTTTCGDATLMSVSAKDFVDATLEGLRNKDEEILWNPFDVKGWLEWINEAEKMKEELLEK